MRRKLTKSKAPLTRRKVQDQGTVQDDCELNARVKGDGVEITKTVVSPKSKCYSKTRYTTASSSNDDQGQTSAFDYDSDEDVPVNAREAPSGVKRKRGSSKDEESINLQGTSRYKKSQLAINLIKKSDEKGKKNVKKRKGRNGKSSTSSDEEDFDHPVKKSCRLLVPDIELVKLSCISTTTQRRNKKALLNLRKNKIYAETNYQHSEESNVDSATELGAINQKKYNSESVDDVDDDGDDEGDDDPEDDKKDDINRITRLENEYAEQTCKENTVKTTSEIRCPVCSKVFDEFIEQRKFNEHVNNCLDSKGTTATETEIPENIEKDVDNKDDISRTTILENESEQTCKENTVKNMLKIKCPVCNKVFDEFIEQKKFNEHVNNCLDSKGTSTTETDIPENNPKSSLSILQDQLVAFEYQKKEVEKCDDAFGGEDGLFFCHICQKDLSKMNSQRRQQHINKCCDQMEKVLSEEEKGQDVRRDDVKKNTLTCPFCSQEFKSRKSWQPHLKKCAQENNVPPNQLIEIVKQQDQYQQEMESTTHQTEELRTEARPNEDGKKKTGQARKKRKVGQDLRNVDEETQLAMALSASMAPPPPPGNDDRKPKRKRKKDNEVIPALLLRSKEETQNVIAARAAQVVCNKDDDSDEDSISCTPALAPSSLAEQFPKVEKANANIIKEEANDQETEVTESSNQVKEELVKEEDATCTPDTSGKPESASCGDTTVVLLSDMLASADMCRSFLSFLDVPDEENLATVVKTELIEQPTTEVKQEPSEQSPSLSIMIGCSTSLWSMASLDNPESSIKDFYVPGLLPIPSQKPQKKTPRKSSSTSQCKVSAHVATQNTANRCEYICEDEKEETSDKPNKTMSESELTSVSQAANLDILLELAGDSDNVEDDDDSQKSPRNSSVDHNDDDDDDEVFPSSGFCLPVGPNNQSDKADNKVPSCLSVFLQDMAKMVGNKLLSDVMVVTKGNESIPAHSFMLASRSQILANMIREARVIADGKQSTDRSVHLSFCDVEPDAVHCILQYIYTASVNVPQSCMVDVIGLADRLELFELVKACQDSRTIHELEEQEKHGSEDHPEEDGIRCSLTAEELLDAIWQDETGDVEAKQSNQEESQDEWNEGFDDDDIEEVRIFQTQAVRKKTCCENTVQHALEGILNLEVRIEKMETECMRTLNHTSTETDISDSKMVVVKGEGREQNETNFVEECKEETLDKEGIHLKAEALGSCLEEKESKSLEAKELKNKKDDIVHSFDKEDCDDTRRDGIYDDQERDIRKCDTYDDQERDIGKCDTYDDQDRDLHCGDKTKLELKECDKLKEEQRSMSDIQMTDSMSYDVHDDIDNHSDDDDYDDDDDGENQGADQDNNMDCNSMGGKVDLTEDDDDRRDDDDENDGPNHDDDTNQKSERGKVDLTEDDDDGRDDDDENNGPNHDDDMNQNSVRGKVDLTEDDDDGQDDDDENDGPNYDDDTNHNSVRGKVYLTEDDDDGRDDDDDDDDDDAPHNNMNAHSVKSKTSVTEDDDDEHDGDGRRTASAMDQNARRSEDDKYKSIDEESDEHEKYKSIDEESEEEYGAGDIAMFNQSISLLSDDNDCESPEKIPDNDLVIPETPHAKKRQRSPNDDQNHEQPLYSIDHPSNTPVPYSPRVNYVSCDLSNEGERDNMNEDENERDNVLVNEDENDNEEDHVSENEEAFLEKLKSRIDAKARNAGNEKKKGKGRKKASKNSPKSKRAGKDMSKESRSSNSSQRSCTPRVAKSNSDPHVVDLSMDNEIEEVMNEFATNHFESVTEEKDLEGNTSGRENSRSDKDEESCTSLSPPRMLSPRVPSPCYSDFDHEMPSPAVSPVHPDVAIIDANLSPISTPPLRRFPTELPGERSPKDIQTKEGIERRESRASPRMAVLIHERALDSDKESENSDDVALLPLSTAHNGGKTVNTEKKTIEEDNERRVCRHSPDQTVHTHQGTIDSDEERKISSDAVALLPVPTAHNRDKTVDVENKTNTTEKDKDKNRTHGKISSGAISAKSSLFKRLGAAKYGLESTETEASSGDESVESGLDDTPRVRPGNSQTKRPGISQTKSQASTANSPIPDQNDFYDDGGYNCDVDDFGACLDNDDSFIAHAAEQMELLEKQDEPVIQEKPDLQVELIKPRTPAQIQRSAVATPRAQDTSVDSPITPMPDYDSMTTPDLKVEVNKFGVRVLPKKKMKAKLIEIYNYTHPGAAAQTQVNSNIKEKTSKTTKGHSLNPAKVPARTAKPASTTSVSSSQPTREPAKKKRIPASQIRESSDSDDDGRSVRPSSQLPASRKPSSYSLNKDFKRRVASDIDGSSRSCSSSQPASTSRRTEKNTIESASSLSDEDRGAGRGGSESNNDDEEEFGEVSILIDREIDTASQQVNSDNLENRLLSFIESNQDVFLKVVSYQPIDLMALHELIKSNGIKCRLGQVIDFLDTQGITFTTAGQKPRQRRKPTRKKRY